MIRRHLLFSMLAATAVALIAAAPFSTAAPRPSAPRGGARLSSAYERMLRDRLAQGDAIDPRVVRFWELDITDEAASHPWGDGVLTRETGPFGTSRANAVGLGPDAPVNDRSVDAGSCSGCLGRPNTQSETTIAAWANYAVAGYNDSRGFCSSTGAVQGYAVSTNGGASFTDLGDPPALAAGGRYRGDPVHFVDSSTGRFFVLGLYEETIAANSGLALLDGHFVGNTWVVDGNRKFITGGPDFIDKPWAAVDPISHNIYVSYSRFFNSQSTSRIEFMRSTDGGNTWSIPMLMHPASQDGNVQGSRPAVGPDGEVYLYWYEYGSPLSLQHVRRSNDGGLTFGPDIVAAQFYENGTTGGAGYRRGFAPTFASIAVDRGAGPHRGRVYLAYDESVDFYDAPVPALGSRNEIEQNANFANSTSFSVGQVLRGTTNATAPDTLDLWNFSGTAGQTVLFACDSASTATFQMRIQCSQDTTLFQNMKFLAFSQANFPTIAYTLPKTATYYLRMFRGSGAAASYRIATSFDTPTAGERARDMRDQFVVWSDNGTSWSAPIRVNDSPAGVDGIFPEVAVDSRGRVTVFWHDWRDDPACGALSTEYMVQSGSGGLSWGANRRVSDATSFWSINACGSANQGDYQGITVEGQTVMPCWADSRFGDGDVFTEAVLSKAASTCPSSPQLAAGGSNKVLNFTLQNAGNVESSLAWRVEDSAGWLTTASPSTTGSTTLAASGSTGISAAFALPANCTPSSTTVRFLVQDDAVPGLVDTCSVTLACGVLDVPGGVTELSFARPQPNPSRGGVTLLYALPRDTPVRLALYSASGRLVRGLQAGRQAAGMHAVRWDGRDDSGRQTSPGIYFARFEAEGRVLRQSLTLLR
ncbi:MAG: FlgD immunoglobulin-like domain containing protein [Candidatus Eisenbacteria bacterium]